MKNNLVGKLFAIVILLFTVLMSILLVENKLDPAEAKKIVAWFGLAVLLLGSVYMLFDKNALRDSSTQKGDLKPYSYSRVQLWWWSIIIIGSYLGVYAATGNYWDLNTTCLTLLGISTITTVSGKIVDNQQNNDQQITRSQDTYPSQGFIMDILSDENGMSVHRFQAFVFNISFGLSFVVTVFSDLSAKAFPTYSPTILGALGVSSGTYLAMKMNENKSNTQSASTTPVSNAVTTSGDELPDLNNKPAVAQDN